MLTRFDLMRCCAARVWFLGLPEELVRKISVCQLPGKGHGS